ncbi:MAG TPA: diguanylate cyclase [Baekduia sp.]|uniref:diguanylate cyclase n=1 Tax=Baekduia sp. TaxID=2600305 RepID=UPI002D77C54D|nr:diguanylate cyclase [Baekduia sp.]HET6506024.1 diguanylate cyclase [Baekduia sp.]
MTVSHPDHDVSRLLEEARDRHLETPGEAMAVALRCERAGREAGRDAVVARALALQGMVTLHRGGLRPAFTLAAEAAALVREIQDPSAVVEVAALEAHLGFFSGSYREALASAETCVAVADLAGDDGLRLYARRCGCVVFANLDAPEWPERLDEMLALSLARGSAWEEAMSRNDLANRALYEREDHDDALVELDRALEAAERVGPRNGFARAVILCSRAEVGLARGDAEAALEDARAATASLETAGADGMPNPYIFGMIVCVEVKALLAAGRADEAWRAGRAAVSGLGESVPQARSMILADVAAALAAAGRGEDAYRALLESAELERLAYRELTELHRDFERAVIEQDAARREAETLAAKNRELEATLDELAATHRALEALQAQLREQAERDWLTGCYNRRYLAATLEELAVEHAPVSVAVLDLDRFKSVNDRFGHSAGDRVLARAAALLHENVRASDVVTRAGGEEFVIVMPWTDERDAATCAERLRAAIAADDWSSIASGMEITTSIGLVTSTTADDVEAAVRLADRRLYAAKSAGRNRVDDTSFAPAA